MSPLRPLTLLLALCLSSSLQAHPVVGDPARYVSTTLAVQGAVEQAQTLDLPALRQLVQQHPASVTLKRQPDGVSSTLRGVRLRDLLAQARIVSKDHNDVKKTIIIATASDGYAVVFSWSELFNSALSEDVLVYLEKDGAALGDDEGRIALISAQDLRTGPRHVKWLQRIDVKKVVE
ncbi:molybdopterin-dependent oxidoreductase [Duganella qianjiadongensis]|uniref:Molybdopterin-dependent oxidoreductase n=1 Tax=Duganella qianjiadongensis TaxID=2692176 RepID=A0ABW9VHN4_9BURK|nr:molybdopterin-dependent oxidoreductase [Duganella qianjiadongensis]MYM39133.1 molybdopterin-dependent oxidoreductase [Duganella qianjiadongensis]